MAESPVEKDLGIANIMGEKIEIIGPVNSPSLDFNDNEDIPTELSDSSETHDEGTWGRVVLVSVVSSLLPSFPARDWSDKYLIPFLDPKSSEDAKNCHPGLQKVNVAGVWKDVPKITHVVHYPCGCSSYCPGISGGKGLEVSSLGSFFTK